MRKSKHYSSTAPKHVGELNKTLSFEAWGADETLYSSLLLSWTSVLWLTRRLSLILHTTPLYA